MVETHGRLGRKNRKGFYDYPEAGPKRLWPGLAELVGEQQEPERVDMAGAQAPAAGDAGAGSGPHL